MNLFFNAMALFGDYDFHFSMFPVLHYDDDDIVCILHNIKMYFSLHVTNQHNVFPGDCIGLLPRITLFDIHKGWLYNSNGLHCRIIHTGCRP